MGGDDLMLKRSKFGIHDAYRGIFLNRGVFVKAPPGFFQMYPTDFEPPPPGYEKLNVHIRTIENWDPKKGILGMNTAPKAPVVEIPVPAPTPVAQTVASSEQLVAEPVAEAVEEVVEEVKPKSVQKPRRASTRSRRATVR